MLFWERETISLIFYALPQSFGDTGNTNNYTIQPHPDNIVAILYFGQLTTFTQNSHNIQAMLSQCCDKVEITQFQKKNHTVLLPPCPIVMVM